MSRTFYVYSLSSHARTLYIGVTNNLVRRLYQHRAGEGSKYARRYRTSHLVYYELTENSLAAITREKQLKGWRRARDPADRARGSATQPVRQIPRVRSG